MYVITIIVTHELLLVRKIFKLKRETLIFVTRDRNILGQNYYKLLFCDCLYKCVIDRLNLNKCTLKSNEHQTFDLLEFRKGCWDTTYPSSLTTQHLGSTNKGLVGSSGGGNGSSGVGGLNTNSVSSGNTF